MGKVFHRFSFFHLSSIVEYRINFVVLPSDFQRDQFGFVRLTPWCIHPSRQCRTPPTINIPWRYIRCYDNATGPEKVWRISVHSFSPSFLNFRSNYLYLGPLSQPKKSRLDPLRAFKTHPDMCKSSTMNAVRALFIFLVICLRSNENPFWLASQLTNFRTIRLFVRMF